MSIDEDGVIQCPDTIEEISQDNANLVDSVTSAINITDVTRGTKQDASNFSEKKGNHLKISKCNQESEKGSGVDDWIMEKVGEEEDCTLLRNIFPDEIWLKILAKLTWSSKLSACDASPFFKRILHPLRQQFLFPNVWKILGTKYEHDSYRGSNSTKDRLKTILNLRFVCKDWRDGIHHFYETRPPAFNMKHGIFYLRADSELDWEDEVNLNMGRLSELGDWTVNMFKPPDAGQVSRIQSVLEHFNETHGSEQNPFIGRSIVIGSEEDFQNQIDASFLAEFRELLIKYGKHIWFFSCLFYTMRSRPVDCLLSICQWLQLMPNLKVLKIELDSILSMGVTKPQENDIRSYLAIDGAPRLENLQLVSFKNVPEYIMRAVLKANSHVSKVEFNVGVKLDVNHIQRPNLRHLSYVSDTMEDFQLLENCSQDWQLETLYIDFELNFPYIPKERIFALAERWQNTLTDAMICLPKSGAAQNEWSLLTTEARLNLPKVKRFRLESRNTSSIDFILPMKSLKLLEVKMNVIGREWSTGSRRIREELKKNEIQYLMDSDDNPYKYNIWELFPHLKRLHTQDSFTHPWSEGLDFVKRKYECEKEIQSTDSDLDI